MFKTIWFGVWIYTLFMFWTVTAVPYESLGPELTNDYNDRTVLFAVRDGFLIAGTLVAVSAPAFVKTLLGLGNGPEGERAAFFWIGLMYAPLLFCACAWCVYRLRERPPETETGRLTVKEGFRLIRHNRPFLILITAFTISGLGSNLPAALILYYVQYVLVSTKADLSLLAYFVTGILFLPLWIHVAGTIGKKEAWLLSMKTLIRL